MKTQETADGRSIAVMQPYLFPYVGYFQLIASVDRFVFFDDVDYIRRGWINRNRIWVSDRELLFSFPVEKAPVHTRILDVRLHHFDRHREKFLRMLRLSYKRAPRCCEAVEVVERALAFPSMTISEVAKRSIMSVCEYLDLTVTFVDSVSLGISRNVDKEERVIRICEALGASRYINAPGGRGLYSHEAFAGRDIALRFLNPKLPNMPHSDFSIIHLLMHLSKEELREALLQGDMISDE